jgi:hypothetical protein
MWFNSLKWVAIFAGVAFAIIGVGAVALFHAVSIGTVPVSVVAEWYAWANAWHTYLAGFAGAYLVSGPLARFGVPALWNMAWSRVIAGMQSVMKAAQPPAVDMEKMVREIVAAQLEQATSPKIVLR